MRRAPGWADRAVRASERWGWSRVSDPSESPSQSPPDTEAEGDRARVIIVGYGPGGRTLSQLFRSLGVPYLIVDTNDRNVRDGTAAGEPMIFGDATRPAFLERLEVANAKLVAVAISDPLATRRIVARIRALAPDLPILARARFVQDVDSLVVAGSSAVVAEEFEGGIELVRQALGLFDYNSGAIRKFTEALREEDYGMIRDHPGIAFGPWLVELLEHGEPEWITVPDSFGDPRSLADLDLRARTGASILAVERAGAVDTVPSAQYHLRAGDRLLVIGDASALEALEQLLLH